MGAGKAEHVLRHQRCAGLATQDDCALLQPISGRWVYFIGDSTHREIHDALLRLVAGVGP